MKQRIKQYIISELLGLDTELNFDQDLLNSGLIDSLGIMRLVAFVEDEAAIEIPPADLVLENFQTVDAIEAYIESRTV